MFKNYSNYIFSWMTQSVLAACITALVVIVVGFQTDGSVKKSETLYLLSLLSYFDNDTSPLQPRTDGAAIIAGAELAVAEINNRSDILENYRLELEPGIGESRAELTEMTLEGKTWVNTVTVCCRWMLSALPKPRAIQTIIHALLFYLCNMIY